MKKVFRIVTLVICAVILVLSFSACNDDSRLVGESTLLGAPKAVERVEYPKLNDDEYKAFKNCVEKFAADFAAYSYADYDKQDNFAVSPISVYMALALAAQCTAGDTRQEILDALGAEYQQLKTHYSTLYRSLEVEYKSGDKTASLVDLSNSIWVNKGTTVKQSCIDDLSNDFYTYSYSADFFKNNEAANKAVQDFVKEKTRGLIDKNFNISEETLFTLINTLYLKTIWSTGDKDLPFAPNEYDFTAKDGSVKNIQLLQGYYNGGRAVEFDTYTTFYTSTYNGYKIKFILPKDGYTVDQVFTADNIAAVNSIADYGIYDETRTKRYITRVLFPEYKCKYDENIVGILQNKFGIDLFFKDPGYYLTACDFSTLTDESCYCATVQHVTDLTVNKKGIEGAAVTAIAMAGATGAPDPIEIIEADFIVNKAFGFIITDSYNTTLFSGVVNNI